MATLDELLKEGEIASNVLLTASGKWRAFAVRPVMSHARIVIDALVSRLRDQIKETRRLADIARENEELGNRITLAIGELQKTKNNGKSEKAAAIVLSPYQYERLSWRFWPRKSKPARFMNLPIYTAKGVYGPVVLTEEGFNGLSRQAPELMLKAV